MVEVVKWLKNLDIPHNPYEESITAEIKVIKDKFEDIITFYHKVENYFIKGILLARNDHFRSIFVENCLHLIEALYKDENYLLMHALTTPINGSAALTRLEVIKDGLKAREKKLKSEYERIYHLFDGLCQAYRDKLKISKKAIPYLGLFFGDLEFSQQGGHFDYSNLVQGFQYEEEIFSFLNNCESPEKKMKTKILDEIYGKKRTTIPSDTPLKLLSEGDLWELSELIQPRLGSDQHSKDLSERLQFIGVTTALLDSIAHDLNRKTAFMCSSLCLRNREVHLNQEEIRSKLEHIQSFYESLKIFFGKIIVNSSVSGKLEYTFENLFNLSQLLFNQRNFFALSALWDTLRQNEIRLIQDHDWRKQFEFLKVEMGNCINDPKKMSSKYKTSLPMPFFAKPFPKKKTKMFDIDEELFIRFERCFENYKKHHGENFANINRSELKSTILDEINSIQKMKRMQMNQKTPFARARTSSLRISRLKKKEFRKASSTEHVVHGS